MTVKNIGDIGRKLEACVQARSAIDYAVRVYDDAKILLDLAVNAVAESEQVMRDTAAAVEAATEAKVKAVIALEKGMQGLLKDIKNAKNIKRGNALDTCLAAREAINSTAKKVNFLKQLAISTAEVESIANAGLDVAESAWVERKRILDNAIASAAAAQNAILEAATILNS